MAFINENYQNVAQSYLFSEIAKRVSRFVQENPDKPIIRMGIGDVTRPLVPAVIAAMYEAVDEMGHKSTFKGYGPEQGYDFLKQAILENDYLKRKIEIEADEIFVSDGAKSDTGNIGDIFSVDNIVAVTDPVYPVYVDTNIMAGREIRLIPCLEENGFIPAPPDFHADIVYLCSPNNPTGTALTRKDLESWVAYAQREKAVILFDSAYEAFITQPDVPHSIYEIPGAKSCAIEFRSFSKTAGFTGTRCAYSIVPKDLMGYTKSGEAVSYHKLWNRRHTTKFNGAPYIVQRGAAAIYTPDGKVQTQDAIDFYLENARIISGTLKSLGFTVYGGENAPYIWLKCPDNMDSWAFFDHLLNNLHIVGTPGSGFGKGGEGFFRLTAFGGREQTIEAMERIKAYYKK